MNTTLALAGLYSAQTVDKEIVMTRVTVPVGEDIAFLPGTEEKKMTPWMGALLDKLEVLNSAAAYFSLKSIKILYNLPLCNSHETQ